MVEESAVLDALINEQQEEQPVDAMVEEMLPKSRVEELIKKAKLRGRDGVMSDLQARDQEIAQLKEQMQNMQQAPQQMQQQAPNAGVDQQQIIMQQVQQAIAQNREQYQQEMLRQQAEQLAVEYQSKLASGKDQYEDFDDVIGNFKPEAFPELVYLANNLDNTAAIIYELGKNPSKAASLAILAERMPQAAIAEMQKLSQSINANQQAMSRENQANPRNPLNRMQSSPTGQDSGDMSVSDYRALYR